MYARKTKIISDLNSRAGEATNSNGTKPKKKRRRLAYTKSDDAILPSLSVAIEQSRLGGMLCGNLVEDENLLPGRTWQPKDHFLKYVQKNKKHTSSATEESTSTSEKRVRDISDALQNQPLSLPCLIVGGAITIRQQHHSLARFNALWGWMWMHSLLWTYLRKRTLMRAAKQRILIGFLRPDH